MKVLRIASVSPVALPGLMHRTLASSAHGIGSFELWDQSLAPGARTPLHRHNCEEVIVITAGKGVMRHDGAEHAFSAGDVLLCAPNDLHEIINTGEVELSLLGILSASPVPVMDESGNRIPLPW